MAMKTILVLLFLSATSSTVHAQIKKPVIWSYSSKKLSDNQVLVYVKAVIEKGWHIYSIHQKDGGPQRTSLNFLKSKSYTLIGKTTETKPLRKFEDVFGIDVLYHNNTVIFAQKIKIMKSVNLTSIKLKLEFMACTDKECLPPDELVLTIPVR